MAGWRNGVEAVRGRQQRAVPLSRRVWCLFYSALQFLRGQSSAGLRHLSLKGFFFSAHYILA